MKILRILVLGVMGCGGASASAVITSGFYDLIWSDSNPLHLDSAIFSIALSDGYRLTGSDNYDGLPVGFECFVYSDPCTLSTPRGLFMNQNGNSFSYPVDFGEMDVLNPPILMPLTDGTTPQTFVIPFSVFGSIANARPAIISTPVNCDLPTPDSIEPLGTCYERFYGSGIETVTVAKVASTPNNIYFIKEARFDFTTATPEPSSPILLGSAIISFLVYRRYRNAVRS